MTPAEEERGVGMSRGLPSPLWSQILQNGVVLTEDLVPHLTGWGARTQTGRVVSRLRASGIPEFRRSRQWARARSPWNPTTQGHGGRSVGRARAWTLTWVERGLL